MGNSNTKESREGHEGLSDRRGPGDPSAVPGRENNRDPGSRSRNRMSRPDLSLLGISSHGSSRDRDRPDAPFEHRETRQEREARRLERERALRAKERERSLREEHVDGGYLVTLGVYTGTEDFSKPVVRQLQIERKLAPFWRGLNDWSESWAEHQLVAAARGLPIPAADAPPDPELMPRPPPQSSSSGNLNNLTVPMGPRTLSAASDHSGSGTSALPSPVSPGPGKSIPFKPRAKALAAALSVGSRNASSTDLSPKEINLAHDPFVNGQPIEVFLYKDASECPICFLSYPPYLNSTRCCDQPICSECFVQIKRADPHLPEHHPDGQARDPNEGLSAEDPPEMLISEPSACPYCQQPEFGVTYEPPPFRRGLSYASPSGMPGSTAMSSQSSLNSTLPTATTGRRRTHSLSATAPNVITTDRVRPDWATKLAAARAHQARRAAAATALHTAAFLVGGNEQRSILRPGRFSRRNTGTAGSQANAGPPDGLEIPEPDRGTATHHADGSRRTRMEELEEMMIMEAVRLSLATEEDRRKKEEKALRKEAKAREKEERKALKKQGRDPYGGHASGASGSSLSLGLGRRRGNSAASNLRMEATVQGASQAPTNLDREDTADSSAVKGKAIDRGLADSPGEGHSSVGSLPIPTGSGRTGSHLRQMSNASSLGSSLADTPAGSFSAGGYAGPEGDAQSGGRNNGAGHDEGDRDTGSEPMFNFRSLAEMVGVNIDDGSARRQEGEHNDSPVGSAPARPLSQVKEDDMEEAEAEHVEGNTSAPAIHEVENPSTNKIEQGGNNVNTPELTITPETPAVEGAQSELKRLGEPSITEQPRQAS
ncbi:C2H2 zinc finger protein [Paramyrothecium foliicola]|nr:C2H2 zinc finger protein [Paramyrothecium foliicola]